MAQRRWEVSAVNISCHTSLHLSTDRASLSEALRLI